MKIPIYEKLSQDEDGFLHSDTAIDADDLSSYIAGLVAAASVLGLIIVGFKSCSA